MKPAKHMDFPINGDETQTHVGTPMKPQQTQTPHMALSILYRGGSAPRTPPATLRLRRLSRFAPGPNSVRPLMVF